MDVLGTIPSPFGGLTISTLLNNAVSLTFIIAFILVFFFIIFGGIKWVISGGDQKQLEAARNMITAAIVGLAIVALAFVLVGVLGTFFNLKLFEFQIPTAGQAPSAGSSGTPRPRQPSFDCASLDLDSCSNGTYPQCRYDSASGSCVNVPFNCRTLDLDSCSNGTYPECRYDSTTSSCVHI